MIIQCEGPIACHPFHASSSHLPRLPPLTVFTLFFLLSRVFLFLLLLVLDINAFLEGITTLVKKGALVAIV